MQARGLRLRLFVFLGVATVMSAGTLCLSAYIAARWVGGKELDERVGAAAVEELGDLDWSTVLGHPADYPPEKVGAAQVVRAAMRASEELGVLSRIGLIAFLAKLLPLFVFFVYLLVWVHRAATRVRESGATGLSFSPGWAVGWFFVPVLGLWKPYCGLREIWKASARPGDWQSMSVPRILPAWWWLWLLSNVAISTSLKLVGGEHYLGFLFASLVADAAIIAAGGLFFLMVRKLDSVQEAALAQRG